MKYLPWSVEYGLVSVTLSVSFSPFNFILPHVEVQSCVQTEVDLPVYEIVAWVCYMCAVHKSHTCIGRPAKIEKETHFVGHGMLMQSYHTRSIRYRSSLEIYIKLCNP